jgi:TonB-linked SusC/RagA family outer membrane protein
VYLKLKIYTMKRHVLLMCVALLFFAGQVFGQERVVTGKVTSQEDGSPIPGANVLVKGSSSGTATDADGNYSISITGDNTVLVFSFLGYQSAEVQVGSRTSVDVQLATDITQLTEVVVVGYGTQLKQDLTGNIASVDGSAIQSIPVPTFEQAIQGRAAGVFVEAGNGKLGQGIKVRVRGSSSVSAGNQPLYVIDGIPVTSQSQATTGGATNPLADINSNDIESIEILKDASAGAIYGSRAANGVVLITTKRGKTGKTNFSVNYLTGFSKPTNHVEWLNTEEYVELFTESNGALTTSLINRFNRYGADPAALTAPTGVPYESWAVPGAPGYVDTNWDKEAFQDAKTNQFDFSASGGTDKTKFFTSLTWSDQDGILVGNRFQKMGTRLNVDHEATDKLSIGVNFSLSRTVNYRLADDNAFSTPLQMVALSPMTPPVDPRTDLISGALNPVTGLPNSNYPIYYNPLLDVEYNDRTTTVWRNLGTVYGNYKIIEGLTFRTELGFDLLNQHEVRYFASQTARNSGAPNGQGEDHWTQVFNYTTNNFFQYAKSFDVHDLDVVVGMSFQESNTDFGSVTGQQFASDSYRKVTSAASITAGTSTETGFAFLSYFARANYKFSNKYLVGLSGRVDGSSRFGPDSRYGFFPAASLGWVLTEESFLADNGVVDFLKLRGSYGLTGNAEIGNFPWQGLYSGDGGYAGIPGQRPSQLENPDLHWEQTAQADIGIEFGFLNSRISGQIDYYNKKTSDLLLQVNLPAHVGAARTQTQNVGELENTGFEFVLNTENLVGELKWNTSFNIARNKNEITNIKDQVIEGSFLSRAVEGEPIGIFFGPKYAGVDPANGDALYYVKNPDGSLSTTNDYNSATFMKIGDPNPEIIWGLTNNLSYKGIDLTFLFMGVHGNDVYNGGGKFMSANGDFFDNQTRDQLDRWQNPGDITDVPQARLFGANGTGESSRYISDGSYVRLKTLTLGYTLPQSIISKASLTKVRVYVSGQNLLTFTDYKMWDPEVNSDSFESNVTQGTDFYSAPQPKTITFGINIGF